MRRFAITTVALLGLAAPGAALAQGAAQPPAPPSSQAPPQPAAPAAADATDLSRSLFEPAARQFLIGGRVTSIDGDPARFQRYQDQRDGLLFSNFRYSFAKPDGTWDFDARADNVGYRDQEFMGQLRPDRQAVAHRQLAADSAVLQRRYDDAVYGHRRHAAARRRDAARDPERRQANAQRRTSRWRRRSNCASGATSAVST